MIYNSQKGVSLYLAIMLMTLILSIALGISTILIGQMKMIRAMGNSVVAFYAADTGIEEVLLGRSSPSSILETTLSNGAKYQVIVTLESDSDCFASNFCIKSEGWYQGTKRAIEITY